MNQNAPTVFTVTPIRRGETSSVEAEDETLQPRSQRQAVHFQPHRLPLQDTAEASGRP